MPTCRHCCMPPSCRRRHALRHHCASAAAAQPTACRSHRTVLLTPPPLPLPHLLPRRLSQAAANIALSRCRQCHTSAKLPPNVALSPCSNRHCRCRRAAAKLLPTTTCRAAATGAVAVLLPQRCRPCAVRRRCAATNVAPKPSCGCCRAVALLPPLRRHQIAANVEQLCCRHRCCPLLPLSCHCCCCSLSCCRTLLPIIVFHCRHRRHRHSYRCRRAATTAATITVVEITILH